MAITSINGPSGPGAPCRLHRFETGDFVLHRNGKTYRLGLKLYAERPNTEPTYWATVLIVGGRPPRRYGPPMVISERNIQKKVRGDG